MGTHNICLNKIVDKKYTCYNLKPTELLDCGLIGVCAVIRLNMVLSFVCKLNEMGIRKYIVWRVPNIDSNKPACVYYLIRVLVLCMKKLCILGCSECVQ